MGKSSEDNLEKSVMRVIYSLLSVNVWSQENVTRESFATTIPDEIETNFYNNYYYDDYDLDEYDVERGIKKKNHYARLLKIYEKQPDFKRFCFRCSVNGESDTLKLKDKCKKTGHTEPCFGGNDACFVEQRKNGGKIQYLNMRCMSSKVCKNTQNHLSRGPYYLRQCEPTTKDQSHCMGCCNTQEDCNLVFMNKN